MSVFSSSALGGARLRGQFVVWGAGGGPANGWSLSGQPIASWTRPATVEAICQRPTMRIPASL
jgi:hypothetical protein